LQQQNNSKSYYEFHILVGNSQTRILASIRCGYGTYKKFNTTSEAQIPFQSYNFSETAAPQSPELTRYNFYLWGF
jgi:hypothetical protein